MKKTAGAATEGEEEEVKTWRRGGGTEEHPHHLSLPLFAPVLVELEVPLPVQEGVLVVVGEAGLDRVAAA